MAASFEVKHLQKNRFTHPLSLSILHLEPFPRRDSNQHRNKISSLKPTGGERGSALLCSQGDPPDLWQPPGDGVSLWVNPGRGGGGTGSDSEENSWYLVNQGKILSVKKTLNKATCEKLAVEATKKELRQSVHLARSQTYKEEYMLDITQVMVLFSSSQNTKKHCRAPISTYVIWSFSGLKRESSHTHSVENVVLTRV
ncbi:unnamed protein product [Brassica oleracea]|uniref:Uncharacterized protein n=1 Tax=Brassica oleracea TaxID=3712 RepID=A0A3P6FTQ7_BRAOL|nr:unnamed protein product [Brassica oleracea]